MASLQLASIARKLQLSHRPALLYKRCIRELPRILMIYDVDHIPVEQATKSIKELFYDNKDIKDHRVREMLVEQGYMSLETTMLQHKQKTHLMRILESYTVHGEADRKRILQESSIDEQFARD